jgi:hypothetical protein
MDTQEQRDEVLWKLAKKRSSFKLSVAAYVVMNAFLTGIWYFTTGVDSYFWPAWCMLGWGIGVVFQFIDAYMTNGFFSEEKEYEKLKRSKAYKEGKN